MLKKIIIGTVILVIMSGQGIAEAKRSDLAGSWYSSSEEDLRREINNYLEMSYVDSPGGEVIGVLAPHAGIRFSGIISAYAYKLIQKKNPRTVVLVGFTHRKHYPGKVSVFTDDSFVTPLGEAIIDRRLTDRFLKYSPELEGISDAFSSENSIELQIPFIQVAAPDAKLVILAITDQTLENCRFLADILAATLRDEKECVIIASSDMSHYLPYEEANEKDSRTIELMKKMDPEELYKTSRRNNHDLCCGYGAIYAVMSASKKLGADTVKILKYANSGNTSGTRDSVVGYLSAAFIRSSKEVSVVKERSPVKETLMGGKNMLDADQKKELLRIARDTIRQKLENGTRLEVATEDEYLQKEMGVFVTLHKNGRLRGCMGSMVAREPLYLAVRNMAIASASQDYRFPTMSKEEIDEIDIEISALTPMRKISDSAEIELGKHGVMVIQGENTGVYLPQVATETGWTKEEFMDSLCTQKARIPHDAWKTGQCDIFVFTAEVFGEESK